METISLQGPEFEAVRRHAVVVTERAAIFHIAGPGAVACLQGLLTNDVERGSPNRLIYGALLTPKGMIVVDYWVFRVDDEFLLVADPSGHAPSLDLFRRQLPPRLARVSDLSETWRVLRVLGPAGATAIDRWPKTLGHEGPPDVVIPEPGRSVRWVTGTHTTETDHAGAPAIDDHVWVGRGVPTAPFTHLVTGPTTIVTSLTDATHRAGAILGDRRLLRAARVLAGVPTLGAEIGDRTLPQEVRFGELDGVAFDKGCYVGQETVARVHFRGHPNWLLRGVVIEAEGTTGIGDLPDILTRDQKTIGRLKTVVEVAGGPTLGLASVRREIGTGTVVEHPIGRVHIVDLPFDHL